MLKKILKEKSLLLSFNILVYVLLGFGMYKHIWRMSTESEFVYSTRFLKLKELMNYFTMEDMNIIILLNYLDLKYMLLIASHVRQLMT